jgi:Superfamily I DNA and RNA helicases
LINAAKEFTEREGQEDLGLEAFLQEVALFTDQDSDDEENDDYVTLMTVHASKGLEFRGVFLVGLEEGLFPSQMAMQDRESIEEERRLFYVAVTRAKDRLFVSHALTRYRFGNTEANDPSRFLDELNEDYITRERVPGRVNRDQVAPSPFLQRPKRGGGQQEDTFNKPQMTPEALKRLKPVQKAAAGVAPAQGDDLSNLEAGTVVEHHKFGRGKVVRLDGQGDGRRAIIEFKNKGPKTLLLKYARLKIVEA